MSIDYRRTDIMHWEGVGLYALERESYGDESAWHWRKIDAPSGQDRQVLHVWPYEGDPQEGAEEDG